MDDIYNRTELLIGKDKLEIIKGSKVCVFGIGGVGSYVVETLARAGIGNLYLVDKDIIDVSNINRQILALNSTVGMDKVGVMADRVRDINPCISVTTLKKNVNSDNIEDILDELSPDYIVDCVDNVDAKIGIIEYSFKKGIKCISCMGMANRLNPLDITVSDIHSTSVCPLAKIIRKKLKYLGITKQKVVFSKEVPIKTESKALGSVSFVPSVAGIIIASEVIKDLIK